MGMTIDEARTELISGNPFTNKFAKALVVAIDTMRKYQKIEEIYKRFQKDGGYYHHMAWLDVMEVMEDGNDG